MKRSHRTEKLMQEVENSGTEQNTAINNGKNINNLLTTMLVPSIERKSGKCADLEVNSKNISSASYPISPNLLAKKLLSLRNADTRKSEERKVCSPVSTRSISQPPYSPLTPLMLQNEQMKINNDEPKDSKNNTAGSTYYPISAKLIAKKLISAKSVDSKKAIAGEIGSPTKSISPPPYSPLTPLMLQNKPNTNNNVTIDMNEDSPLSFKSINSPLTPFLLQNTSTKMHDGSMREATSSPLPPMTPETYKLLDTLNDPLNIMREISDDIQNNPFDDEYKNTDVYDDDDDDENNKGMIDDGWMMMSGDVDCAEENEGRSDSQLDSDYENDSIGFDGIQMISPNFRAQFERQPQKQIKRRRSENDLTKLSSQSLSHCKQSSKTLYRTLSLSNSWMPTHFNKREANKHTDSVPESKLLASSTPKTQNLLKTLTAPLDITEFSVATTNIDHDSSNNKREKQLDIKDIDEYVEDDDDSVKDPDYNACEDQNEDETDSQFESDDEDVDLLRKGKYYNKRQTHYVDKKSAEPDNMQPTDNISSSTLRSAKPFKIKNSESDITKQTLKIVSRSSSTPRSLVDLTTQYINKINIIPLKSNCMLLLKTGFDDPSLNYSQSVPETPHKGILSKNDLLSQYDPLCRTRSIDNGGIQSPSCSFRAQFEMLPKRPIKRRVSETILTAALPFKRTCRSSSSSGGFYSLQKPVNELPKKPKKKRIADPTKWKRNIEKEKRLKGEAYTTAKGKCVPAKPPKEPKCVSIKTEPHKCNDLVKETQRKKIYQAFRALKTLAQQREFIIRHVSQAPKKRTTVSGPSRKTLTKSYSLPIDNNKTVKVCRDFFLGTLNITDGMVRGAFQKLSSDGILECDKRGKKEPPNKLSPERHNFLVNHILSYPAMESHYCRQNSQYQYLDSQLNLSIMYKEYKKLCQDEGETPAGIETYRSIFRTYKLKFHVPKKDLCKKCVAQKELKKEQNIQAEPSQSKTEFDIHLKRKNDAFKHRDEDKAEAKEHENVLAFNFDLESVLTTPKGAAGPFFYVRKLAVYNLTFYNLGNQDVDCYTWDETEGKRGSSEIATSVYKYINSQPPGITHVKMMSDNCGGQQKNFNFCCMLLYLTINHPTIKVIDHAFFETGHTHMECDSIHSKIEQKSKNTPVYTPDGWTQIMRLARTNPRPFNVKTLLHDDFMDFNSNQVQFAEQTAKNPKPKPKKTSKKRNQTKNKNQNQNTEDEQHTNNTQIDANKRKPKFTDAVWIQYRKENPNSIFIKTDYDDECFMELKLTAKKKGQSLSLLPKSIYNDRLPISVVKKRDLLKLCHDLLIPKAYHHFYDSLPTSQTVVDRLPEPDADEED